MSLAAAAVAAEQVILRVLEEGVSRVARKAAEGKKLSDREVSVLMMSAMTRRLEDFRVYVDGRMEGMENRLNVVHGVVSSIKTDVIKMMREYSAGHMERRRAKAPAPHEATSPRTQPHNPARGERSFSWVLASLTDG
jgi:hypothetical protein